MRIQKADYSHVGGRIKNEDNLSCEILSDSSAYAIVADGVGGHGDGDIASQIAVQCFSQCRYCTALPSQHQISQWFQTANEEINIRNQSAAGMKTTAVFLAVWNSSAIWAHIGDSRLYHFYNGQLSDYTCDHSVSQVQVQAGELTREQIPFSPDRNKILRSLGNATVNEEIHSPVPLLPGRHAFLLCTDGFWEYLSEAEIQLDLLKSGTPETWLAYLRCRGDMRKNRDADNNSAAALFLDV